MTLVIDTNVMISALISSGGNASKLLKLWRENVFEIAVSESILQEYKAVLQRPKFAPYLPSPEHVTEFFEELEEGTLFFSGLTPVSPIHEDRSDEKFLSCAVEAGAAALITGDHKHLLPIGEYRGIQIITPATCLSWLAKLQTTKAT